MSYIQSVNGCLEHKIGYRGLPEKTYLLWQERCTQEMIRLQEQHRASPIRLFSVVKDRQDIADATEALDQLKAGAETIIFFGTGGSSLGGQTLAHFSKWYLPGQNQEEVGAPRIRFYDNLDADTLERSLKELHIPTTRFVIISKSGSTAETLLQALSAIQTVKNEDADLIPKIFLALTEPKRNGHKNGLRDLCDHFGIPVLDHEVEIGGRYSGLTNVGLLPAILRGLDVAKIREGADNIVTSLLTSKSAEEFAPADAASVIVGLTLERDIHNVVMMPYADQLGRLSNWFVQLWAESLGKDGKGATPVAAQGPVDQHSQLQLYLDGRPHMLTLIRRDCSDEGPRISPDLAKIAGMDFLANRTAGDLVYAEQRAIHDALIEAKRPVRTINVTSMTESTLGALMMHFMIETILTARLLGINPFDQPAVETGKRLTKQYLDGTRL